MNLGVFNSVCGSAFFRRMVAEWQTAGVTVDVHEAVSQSDYRGSAGVLSRFGLRWRMYVGYAWVSWRAARRQRGKDSMQLATTNPFFLPALVARAAGPKVPTIHLLYDLYPEALIEAGVLSADSLAARWCVKITRYALRKCAVTVFLGRRLQAYTERTYGPARKACIIPVGADGVPFRDREPRALCSDQAPIILYCGQMGRMHDIETTAAVLPQATARRFTWRFHAGGAGYTKFKERAPNLPGVVFGNALGDSEWVETMLQASIALVTIARGGEKVVMPSKTYSALVAGQAILAICVRDSDLADLVLKHDCGWVVEPGDAAGLAGLLDRLATSPDEVLAKRRNAYLAGHAHFDMAPVAQQWLTLFADLNAVRDAAA